MSKFPFRWIPANPGWVKIERSLAAPSSVLGLLAQKNTVKQAGKENLFLQHSQGKGTQVVGNLT